jgi:hypothetical protein
MGTEVMLSAVRCSFLTLGEPEYFGGQKQKASDKRRWSATGLVPTGSALHKKLDMLIEQVAAERWEKKAASVLANIRSDPKASCFVDGNRKDYEGYKDHWALTAHRNEDKGRPLVYDSDKSPIYKPDNEIYEGKGGRIYSGCYVNLNIEIWAQDNANGKAIRATLLGIQRVKDGDAFSGGTAPNPDSFEEITEGSDADDLA